MIGSVRTLAFAATLVVLVPKISAASRSYAVDVTACRGVSSAEGRCGSNDVVPPGDWRAQAIEVALSHDLADDRLAIATGSSADLVVHATIDQHELHYELRATWPGGPAPITGAITLGAADRAEVAGQLRDGLHRLARATRDDRIDVSVTPPSREAVLIAFAFAAFVLAIPFVIGRARGARPALRRAAFAATCIGGATFAATWIDVPWLLAGGLAWGGFVAVTVPIVFPPVIGFGRIEQGELARVLATWLAAVVRRTAAAIIGYGSIAVATWFAGRALDLDPGFVLVLAVPLAWLAVRLWVRCAAAVAAAMLDDRLADATVDATAWHAATREYVVGYLRRAGLPVDAELLARVRFVPGTGDSVAVYGGGLTASRIVIPSAMLELALAPAGRPHDYAAPRVSTLHWAEWNAGLVVATDPGAVVATAEQRQPRTTTADDGEHERQLFGEPPTLAGTIEPSDLDARRTYRPHEDRIWLDWDPGDEYDGTDPGDLDFLFGAVVEALGEIQRHADRLATFTLLARRAPRTPALADDHATLAGARHHLVQYLGWRLWRREDLLTARAFAPELEAATAKIFATLGDAKTGDPRLRRRIARLADPDRAPAWRRFAVAGALAACAAVLAIAVAGAVRYHATYIEEITHG